MRFFLILFIPVLTFSMLQAQVFYPEIENYTIENYQADNQNWGIDVDEQGVVYVANNKGLLRYNGQIWYLYELPNKTIVRSVFSKDNRVYTGSYEEFGYWTRDARGSYMYTSLIDLLSSDHTLANEEFWEIIEFKNNIYFRSFGGIYKYDGKLIQFIPDSYGVVDFEIFQNDLLVSIRNSGLYKLENDTLKPVLFDNASPVLRKITNIASREGVVFLYDEDEGAFLHEEGKLIPLSPEINSLLKNTILNKVTFVNGNELAFGTIKKGVIIYEIGSKQWYALERSSGLHNNTVLGLEYDKGLLWVALDNGISKINFKNPFYYYTDITGTLGTVYDVVFFKNSHYLGSNTGIHRLSDAGELHFVKGSEGQVWDLHTTKGHLLAGHNNGIYKIENDTVSAIDLSNGGVFEITPIDNQPEQYFLGTYSGISKLRYEDGNWQTQQLDNVDFPVKKIISESENIIWASHPYKGIYRIKLAKDHSKAIGVKDYGGHENFKQYTTTPFLVEDKVVFQNSGQWFRYFQNKDSIGDFSEFSGFYKKDFIGKEARGYWFFDRGTSKKIAYVDDEQRTVFQMNSSEIEKRLVSGYEKILTLNDSLRVLNLNDGMVFFNFNRLQRNYKEEISAPPVIDKVSTKKSDLKILSDLTLPFTNSRNITFEVYAPNRLENEISYALSGRLEQKGVLENGKVILQNLPYGDYTLDFSNKEATTTVQLNILPPWYWSMYLKIVYIIIFLLIIYWIYRRNRIKIRKQHIAMQRAYIKQTQERIAQLEKENLEREVLEKKRELTSSTASVIKKNEMIIELRNELNRLKDVSPNQYRTKRLLTISKNYLGDDNDWKIFQSSFNDLHKDFFKKLLDSYPKLTTKDLKLCAYIKTGLTTKEIAPLMGITIRGVELHRYRLRKKLELSTDDNFQNFLTLF